MSAGSRASVVLKGLPTTTDAVNMHLHFLPCQSCTSDGERGVDMGRAKKSIFGVKRGSIEVKAGAVVEKTVLFVVKTCLFVAKTGS